MPKANTGPPMNCPSCGAENPAEASFCMSCGTIMVPPTESASSSPSEMGTSSDFVGRHREMADLKAALEDAISGHGRLLMLVRIIGSLALYRSLMMV